MIDSERKLAAYLPELRAATWVAVDTEADSLHAYPEKVCLIQISTASGDRLIDSLARLNLKPLLEVLAGHELILHGADYDLRLLRRHHKFVPRAIFDTMLAARLLGQRQFGLCHLVKQYLGVTLEKGAQKANWAVRPLTERMERYARNDTHYLKPLADSLRTELGIRGRLAWHQESCVRLIQDTAAELPPDPDSLWRVKGSHALNRPALAVLRELWHWREREARAANRPPFFVMSHEAMVQLAATVTVATPSVEPLLPARLSERRRASLKQALEQGLRLPPEQHPHHPRRVNHRVSEGEKRRFSEIQKRRDTRATALGIDPTLIASRALLARLARDWERHVPELMSWQLELLKA
ncbi:MAG: HRDC domain-containing protein [Verrucomicrobia bacterium]|nr:HRDC domain-containing protein [Verrucomicrobiota bacterium]OQC26187.1 MAG: Ribonuclease D [Verrucomicrobia bacterium ADurb.Bin063]HNW06762.1 HRDC domain-containing protein [Verrucomicrobiota bacterium]HNZ75083.1 HRDC domain-containing protein [Verrucomicrobiota bacterium]HOC50062.1 HRDC domain-containing protein [Verrucomicrobiota bacterium]